MFHIRPIGAGGRSRRKIWKDTGLDPYAAFSRSGTPYAVTSAPRPSSNPRVFTKSRTPPSANARTVSRASVPPTQWTTDGQVTGGLIPDTRVLLSSTDVSTCCTSKRPYAELRPTCLVPSANTPEKLVVALSLRPYPIVTAVKSLFSRRNHDADAVVRVTS